MSQITFEKVNAWSRNFFYIVNKRASFALHAHSLKVQNWSSALITRKITQVHSDCQKIACVASVSNWVTARKLERKQKKWKGEGVGRKGNACPQTPRFWKTALEISRFVSFVIWQLVNTIDNEQITRFEKFTFFPKTHSTRLQNCYKSKLYDRRRLKL